MIAKRDVIVGENNNKSTITRIYFSSFAVLDFITNVFCAQP